MIVIGLIEWMNDLAFKILIIIIIFIIILVFLMFSWCPNRVLGFQDSFHMNWLMIDSCGVYVVGAIVVELCV